MAIIDKIKLSGQTFDIQDSNASKTVELTQAEYDALVTKDPNTYYIITDATPIDITNYYTKTDTDDLLDDKLDVTAYTPTDLSNYYTKSETSGATQIQTALASKQTTLTAGTNISITTGETADTINCTLSGGTLINISNSKINCTAPIRYGTGNGGVIVGPSINTNKASGMNSISNGGDGNTASGQYSYAEGFNTQSTKNSSHSEGWFTIASGNYSHTEGNHTKTTNESEHASGKYNVSSSASTTFGNSGNTLFSVGNGTADNARHNAFEIRQNGDIYLTLDGQDVKLQDQLGGGSSYTAGDGIDITNNVISVTGKADTSAVTEVNDVVTAHAANTAIHVTAQDKSNWNAKSDFSGSYNDLTDKPTIPTVPTNVSDFTNDAGYITSDAISGKADTSAVTEIQDSLSGYVTTDTEQIISGRKIFTYTSSSNKAIEFKQTDDSSKVGFRVRTSAATNNELASFEFRPNTFTIDNVQHPLIYFGHYRTTNAANAGVQQTVVGFRQYDQLNAAAYHYLLPLPDKAKTPFNLTTTFKDYYAPMGFKNGSTMITADNTGVVDISSEFSGKVDTSLYNTYTAATDTALASKADTATTYTKTEVDTALASKQTTLTAGTGISIVDNVINAEGGGKAVSGGTNISVTTGETADTINCTLPISKGSGTSNSLILGTGNGNTASGQYSIAVGGRNNSSSKYCSLVGGNENNVSNEYETAFGNSNKTNYASTTFGDSGNTLFSVGNGSNYLFRHNAFEIRQDGSIYIPDLSNGTSYRDRPMIKLQDALGGGGSSYSAGTGIDITNDVISVSGVVMSSAITTSVTSSSTDAQVPSAKAVNDKLGGLSLVKLTQAEYDALETKDNSTLYVIVN